jgi:hypothetical protein
MALLEATMAAPTEALLSDMTAVTGEGNSPYTTAWICSLGHVTVCVIWACMPCMQ